MSGAIFQPTNCPRTAGDKWGLVADHHRQSSGTKSL